MSDQDVFNDNTPKLEETPPAPNNDLFANQLMQIKNEQGQPKYKDVQTALNALVEAQNFIQVLKLENKDLKEKNSLFEAQLKQVENIEDIINRLNPSNPPNSGQPTGQPEGGLKKEDITAILENELANRELQQTRQTNLATVVQVLTEKFGEGTQTHIKNRAQELGITTNELKQLAMDKPKLALELLGNIVSKPASPVSPTNTLPFKPNTTPEPPKWEKGATRGGLTNRELVERWKQSTDYTNKRLGLDSN